MHIEFLALAEDEVIEAARYYQRKVIGLGDAFLQEVEQVAQWIARYPLASPCVRETIRRKPLPRFPYSLLYRVEDKRIIVIAVAHQKRRPCFWKRR